MIKPYEIFLISELKFSFWFNEHKHSTLVNKKLKKVQGTLNILMRYLLILVIFVILFTNED